MKFRARMMDLICIHQFTRILSTISKMVKMCVVRLTANKVYFILIENNVGSVWCELFQKKFFGEYNLEGISQENNEIYLEVVAENLVKVLRSAHAAKSVKMKLTRKHGASLTFEVELVSVTSRSQLLVHDIHVSVVARRLWSEFQEPDMPIFDVITASKSGTLRLRVESDEVTIKTRFKDLECKDHPILCRGSSCASLHQVHGIEEAEVRADIRKLSQFLNVQQINPNKVLCNVVHHRTIHFLLIHDDMTLQYFMPAIGA